MKLLSILWIISGIIFIGLMYLKMNMKNLVKIDSVFDYKDVFTQVENGIDNVNNHIRVQQGGKINMTISKSTLQYNKSMLYSIVDKVRSDPRYKVINYRTCNNISKLKLNRRGCRGGVRMKSHLDIMHPKSSNKDNLISINIEQHVVIPNHHSLCICLANIQSIKNKQLILHQYLVENNIDMCVLTKTWLKDTKADQVLLQCSSLNNDGFKCFTPNRQGRRGGGLTLISRDRYKVVPLGTGQL